MFRFSDQSRCAYDVNPIVRANRCETPHKKKQVEKYGQETFVDCPGIFDYKNTGWIMTAWDEFRIYASDKSVMAYAGCEKRDANWQLPKPVSGYPPITGEPVLKGVMSQKITDGIPVGTNTGCPVKSLSAIHFGSPWAVETDEEISLLLLPPMYHSDIVNDFMIFPGIVDYSADFSTINFIAAPRRAGTYTIKAGTPLLHMIPIEKKHYKAEFGPMIAPKIKSMKATARQFYRRYLQKRHKYDLEFVDVPQRDID